MILEDYHVLSREPHFFLVFLLFLHNDGVVLEHGFIGGLGLLRLVDDVLVHLVAHRFYIILDW